MSEGNCLRDCIAFVLGVDIGLVPDFNLCVEPYSWYDVLREWLEGRGVVRLIYEDPGMVPLGRKAIWYGWSPRGDWKHCVVAVDGKMVFDPHSDNLGLRGEPLEAWTLAA